MARRRRKYWIDDDEALDLFIHGYGFIARKMNFYQIRLKHQESRLMWDWYHTQGTVVVTREERHFRWKKQYGNAEELAIQIIKVIYDKEEIKTNKAEKYAEASRNRDRNNQQ